jgi:hypothetical protein
MVPRRGGSGCSGAWTECSNQLQVSAVCVYPAEKVVLGPVMAPLPLPLRPNALLGTGISVFPSSGLMLVNGPTTLVGGGCRNRPMTS